MNAPHRLISDGVDDSEIERNQEAKRENHCDKDLNILLVHLPMSSENHFDKNFDIFATDLFGYNPFSLFCLLFFII